MKRIIWIAEVFVGIILIVLGLSLVVTNLFVVIRKQEPSVSQTPLSTSVPSIHRPIVTTLPRFTPPFPAPPETNPYVIRINNERAKRGLGRLSSAAMLTGGSYKRAVFLVTNNQFSHDGYVEAFIKSGVTTGKIGENLARDYPSIDATIDAWVASPLHAANLFEPKFRYAGIGTYQNMVVLWLSENLR